MMRRTLLLVGLLLAVFVSGCGSTRVVTSTKTQVAPAPTVVKTISQLCPTGRSFMGCATGALPTTATPAPGQVGVVAPVPGCKVVDVSSYQGHPNWAGAARYICAAVAKAGELTEDPDFAWNVAELRSLHIPWGAYWFIRGCGAGDSYAAVLNSVHFRGDHDALRPVLDMEVPAARGCAPEVAGAIHDAFGVWPIIYTALGTWPGGSSDGLETWEADYGSVLGALPFTSTVLAWQRWSPPYTFYCIPDLYSPGCRAYGDVSVDLRGFSRAFAFPVKPKPTHPICFPENAKRGRSAYCKRDYVDKTHFEAEIKAQRALLFDEFCWTAGKDTRSCMARLRRGNEIHAALDRLLSTSTFQP
jgi:hypothetical protein